MLNVDINLLRTFLEIEKTRHFGKAAENLYLTQAAISARVKLLEDTLGTTLFERHRNNIQLTKQGERLLPYASQMVDLWVRTTQEIRVPQNYQDLTIAAPESVWSSKLSELPNKLFRSTSDLQLIVQSIDSNMIARRLLDRTIDIGFLYDQPKIDELVFAKAFDIELALFSNRAGVELADINEKNYVTIDLGISFKQIQAKILPHIFSPIFQAPSWQMAIDFTIENDGVVLLPSSLAKKNKKLFALAQSPTFNRETFFCYSKASLHNPLKQHYIELVQKMLNA